MKYTFLFSFLLFFISYSYGFNNKIILDDDIKYFNTVTVFNSFNYEYDNSFGDSGEIRFYYPNAVSLDIDGNIYVSDHYNKRIVILNKKLQLKGQIKGKLKKNIYLKKTLDITISSKNIYISDISNHIYVFNMKYKYIDQIGKSYGIAKGEFDTPIAIFFNKNLKELLVADKYNDRIQIFSEDNRLLDVIKGSYIPIEKKYFSYVNRPVVKKEYFLNPSGVAVAANGDIYISNSGKNRVVKYNKYGKFLLTIGQSGNLAGNFYYPKGLAIDGYGNIYVADKFNHRIQKFNKNGDLIAIIGKKGSKKGELLLPTDVFVDNKGKVYVADSGNNRIQIFRADYFNMALNEYKKNNFEKAVIYFMKEAKNNPYNVNAFYYMGYCFYRLKDFNKSFLSYNKAYELSPTSRAGAYSLQQIKRLEQWYGIKE